jgi:hypothetical protein
MHYTADQVQRARQLFAAGAKEQPSLAFVGATTTEARLLLADIV